jgi:signal transduction histidine kinase
MTPRTLDAIGAAAMLLVCETELVLGGLDHAGLLAADASVMAVATAAIAWRRRAPLVSASTSLVGIAVVVGTWPHTAMLNAPQLVLFVAPYGLAAFAPLRRAVLGLAMALVTVAGVNLSGLNQLSSWVFSLGAVAGSWAVGRVLRTRRELAAELERTMARIDAERHGRELLVLAEERTRIAQELQTLVAHSVTTMIVQAQAARQLVSVGAPDADEAMATVETTGRAALTEMRRILGVLRHQGQPLDLAPQPGVGQINTLVEQARHRDAEVTLAVSGTPGPLPASVDLGVYRLLQEALTELDEAAVVVTFGPDDVALEVTTPGPHLLWPTVAMRERVALCNGTIDVVRVAGRGERLAVLLPRVFEEVLA